MSRTTLPTRPSRLWLRPLFVVITIVVSLAASQVQADRPHDSSRAVGRGTSSAPSTGLTWAERDRSAYVVSTLNLPLCANGRKLTVLLRQHGARRFDVMKENGDPYLYFIEVRNAANRLLGAYAYILGSPMPTGVQDAPCVRGATSEVVGSYRGYDVIRVARFSTTIPA